MKPNLIKRTILVSLQTLCLLFLAGCFDLSERVVVNEDTSGAMVSQMLAPEGVSNDFFDDAPPIITSSNVQRKTTTVSNRAARIESSRFSAGRVPKIDSGRLAVRADDDSVTVSRTWSQDDLTDLEDMKAAFAGNHYTLQFDGPGEALEPQPAIVNGKRFYPDVDGSVVRYRIPFPQLLEHVNRRDLTISVAFQK